MKRSRIRTGGKQYVITLLIVLVALSCLVWNLTEQKKLTIKHRKSLRNSSVEHKTDSNPNVQQPQSSLLDGAKRSNNEQNSSSYSFERAKKILLYTDHYGWKDQWPMGEGHDPFVRHKCPVSNCYMTHDKNVLSSVADFDALVFNFWHGNFLWTDPETNERRMVIPDESDRRPNQRYVLHMGDPAAYAAKGTNATMINGKFNWTMTYRLNSDQPRVYGWLDPAGQPTRERPPRASDPPFKWKEYNSSQVLEAMKVSDTFSSLAKRPFRVAWLTSHCNTFSRRIEYVEELSKHVDVKVFGECGEQCGRRSSNCTQLIMRDFKFYLAFENSFCDDYVSEKFWRTMQMYVVPIVMGSSHYDEIAPPHSYINSMDFANPKALADYIISLDNDPAAYLSYFWWKSYYTVRQDLSQKFSAWCELCRMLNDPDEPEKVFNEYEDMVKCSPPPWDKKDWKQE